MPQPTQTTPADAAAAYLRNPLRLSMASSRTNFGRQLAFLPRGVIQHRTLKASTRHKLIARDRRGSLLGCCSANNLGYEPLRSSTNGDRRHRRPGAAPDLQRLYDEGEFVGARRCQRLQLQILDQVDA